MRSSRLGGFGRSPPPPAPHAEGPLLAGLAVAGPLPLLSLDAATGVAAGSVAGACGAGGGGGVGAADGAVLGALIDSAAESVAVVDEPPPLPPPPPPPPPPTESASSALALSSMICTEPPCARASSERGRKSDGSEWHPMALMGTAAASAAGSGVFSCRRSEAPPAASASASACSAVCIFASSSVGTSSRSCMRARAIGTTLATSSCLITCSACILADLLVAGAKWSVSRIARSMVDRG